MRRIHIDIKCLELRLEGNVPQRRTSGCFGPELCKAAAKASRYDVGGTCSSCGIFLLLFCLSVDRSHSRDCALLLEASRLLPINLKVTKLLVIHQDGKFGS